MLLTRGTLGAIVLVVLVVPAGLQAQIVPVPAERPAEVPVRLGVLALAPAFRLMNVGWDSNIFNREGIVDPPGDFTAIARPEVQAWIRLGKARVTGRSAYDFVYFRDYSSERSVDWSNDVRLDLPLAHFAPYVFGRWVRGKQRFGYEIDQRTMRHDELGIVGVAIRQNGRTSFDISARRGRLTFDHPEMSEGRVSDFYDFTSRGLAFTLRQRLTPLTAVTATVDQREDRFDLQPDRDSDSLRVFVGAEFKPFALISGTAHAGWQRLRLVQGGASDFEGFVGTIELAYTLLGSTRFSVQAERTPTYSAVQGQHAYVLAGGRLSLLHQLDSGWDVGARLGRYHLTYGVFSPSGPGGQPGTAVDTNHEKVREYGGELAYRIGSKMRVAFDARWEHRRSTVYAVRAYDRTQAVMSWSYEF